VVEKDVWEKAQLQRSIEIILLHAPQSKDSKSGQNLQTNFRKSILFFQLLVG